MAKVYLGDAVYAEINREEDMLRLTTENGIERTNEIYLDPRVLHSLLDYLVKEGVLSGYTLGRV